MPITPTSFSSNFPPEPEPGPTPDQKTEQEEWQSAQSLDAQLPPQGWQGPEFARVQDIKSVGPVAGQNALLATVEGETKPFLVLEKQHPEAYKKLLEYQDAKSLLKSNNDEGYKTVESDQAVPAYGEYVRFGSLDEAKDAIRFEYNRNGVIEKGVVHKTKTPALYERIKHDRELFTKAEEWSKKNNVTIASSNYTPPLFPQNVEKIEDVKDLGQDAIRIKTKDSDQLVLKNVVRGKEFADLLQLKGLYTDLHKSNEEGYATVRSGNDVPSYKEYVRFGSLEEVKDAIRFEYNKDGKLQKGVVHKSQTPDLYERIKHDREIFVKAEEWSKTNKVPIAGPDYKAPLISHVQKIERVDLGQDAIRVQSDGKEQLVLRNMVGDNVFNHLQAYVKHNDYLDRFQSFGARLWTDAKFDTTKFQLNNSVDGVYTKFQDRGIILVNFAKNGGPMMQFYNNQTIVFSEKKTPEAFAIIRKFAESGDDSFKGTMDTKPNIWNHTLQGQRLGSDGRWNDARWAEWNRLETDPL